MFICSKKQDDELIQLFGQSKIIEELVQISGRNEGGVISRLKKLGLIDN